MSRSVYYARRGLAICLGAAMLGYGVWLSWNHFGDLLGPLVSLGGAALLILAENVADERRRTFAVLFAALGLVGSVLCANVVLVRTSETAASKVQAAASGNLARTQADAVVKDTEAALAGSRAALASVEARRKTECASGRGKECKTLEGKEDAARVSVDAAIAKVASARKSVANLGAVADAAPATTTIEALLGSWAPLYQRFLQVAPAVWLELASPLLLAYGFSPMQGVPVPERKEVPARKRRRKSAGKSTSYGTRAYWLARLDKKRPDLARLVRAGELSANMAAIKAGWRKTNLKLVASST